MGTLTFLIPDSITPTARRCLEQANLAGRYDVAPVPTRRWVDPVKLILAKEASESGCLVVPWPLVSQGCPVITSSTLRESTAPYYLATELARGKLNQVRNQITEWESIGLELAADDRKALADAVRNFGRSVVDPAGAESAVLAEGVLGTAADLGEKVTRQFAEQLLSTRFAEEGRLRTELGCRIASVPPPTSQAAFFEAFKTVRLVPNWCEIEPSEAHYNWTAFDGLVAWAIDAGLTVSVGPLMDFAHGPFPKWLRRWEGDLPSLAAFACDFIETVINRYRGRVRSWQVFSGFNHVDAHGLNEDDRLRLAARLLDAARQADPNGLWTVGLAQPWGDYLVSEDHTYSPIVFADTLLRAGYSLAALELELLCGTSPRASWPRDSLDTFHLLDLFCSLNVPLEVTVGADMQYGQSSAHNGTHACPPEWAGTAAVLAASLPNVGRVFWEGWSDADGPRLPGVSLSGETDPRNGMTRLFHEMRRLFLA
ncbi:endo-1,4-beta-xylanase [Fimbriiglobus ruber]|nr:endo-1,4-beta-xylanase [Fimbriiglobus ruber]